MRKRDNHPSHEAFRNSHPLKERHQLLTLQRNERDWKERDVTKLPHENENIPTAW